MQKRRSKREGGERPGMILPAGVAEDPAATVEAVLAMIRQTRIDEIHIEWPSAAIRVKRALHAPPDEPSAEPDHPPPVESENIVTSLYVGIFHRQPEATFPAVGTRVRAGQTIAQVETLRIQNSVVAPSDGVIADVLVADGTPVEYGQPLIVLQIDPPRSPGFGTIHG